MNELIKNILQALNLPTRSADVERLIEHCGIEDQLDASGISALSEELGISEAAIRAVAADASADVEITDDPEATMRTLEELTEARVGRPYIRTTSQIRRSSDEQRTTVIINSTDEDRHGTIIDPNGGSLENYKKNPVFLINHSYGLPAGNGSRVRLQNGQIIAEVSDSDWNDGDDTEKGREIKFWKGLVKEGKVKMASVGIMPLEIKREEREDAKTGEMEEKTVISKWELLEWSFVPVGSNPEALVMQRAMSISGQDPTDLERRIAELETAVSSLKEFKKAADELRVLVDSERLQRVLDHVDPQGQAEAATDTSEDDSQQREGESDASAVPYVRPPKQSRQNRYVPKPQQKSADEIAEGVQDKIKRKQGKR